MKIFIKIGTGRNRKPIILTILAKSLVHDCKVNCFDHCLGSNFLEPQLCHMNLYIAVNCPEVDTSKHNKKKIVIVPNQFNKHIK